VGCLADSPTSTSVLEELVPESVRALREAARIDGAPSATRAPQG
jgi:hypothetical protein